MKLLKLSAFDQFQTNKSNCFQQARNELTEKLQARLSAMKAKYSQLKTESEINLSKMQEMEQKVEEVMNKGCVTCKKFHEKDKRLEATTTALKRAKQRAEVLMIMNIISL